MGDRDTPKTQERIDRFWTRGRSIAAVVLAVCSVGGAEVAWGTSRQSKEDAKVEHKELKAYTDKVKADAMEQGRKETEAMKETLELRMNAQHEAVKKDVEYGNKSLNTLSGEVQKLQDHMDRLERLLLEKRR